MMSSNIRKHSKSTRSITATFPQSWRTLARLSVVSLSLLSWQPAVAYQSSMEYYHHNHQGSLLEVYDGATNKRLLSQAWSPWGERQILHAATGDRGNIASLLAKGLPVRRGYTGHKTLLSTGLIFAGDTRLYDARLKRFLNSDDRTTGGIRGQNRYSYAYNNPMTYTDPDGHIPYNERSSYGTRLLDENGNNNNNPFLMTTASAARIAVRYFTSQRFNSQVIPVTSRALNIANGLIGRVEGLDSLTLEDLHGNMAGEFEGDVDYDNYFHLLKGMFRNGMFDNVFGNRVNALAAALSVRVMSKISADDQYISLAMNLPGNIRNKRSHETAVDKSITASRIDVYSKIHSGWKKSYRQACVYSALFQSLVETATFSNSQHFKWLERETDLLGQLYPKVQSTLSMQMLEYFDMGMYDLIAYYPYHQHSHHFQMSSLPVFSDIVDAGRPEHNFVNSNFVESNMTGQCRSAYEQRR